MLLSNNVNEGASCAPDPRSITYLNPPVENPVAVAVAPEPLNDRLSASAKEPLVPFTYTNDKSDATYVTVADPPVPFVTVFPTAGVPLGAGSPAISILSLVTTVTV